MPGYDVMPEAQADLDDIWETIAEHDVEAADRIIVAIEERFLRFADFPLLGRSSHHAPGHRRFAVPPYVIFYRPIKDGVEILRVLHGSRDLGVIFQPDEGV